MIKKIFRLSGVLAIAVLLASPAHAQFYNTGQAPASVRWKTLATDSIRIIFPEEFEPNARRILYAMEKVRPALNYGFSLPPLRTPVVLTNTNFYSNGLAILAPKHIEIGGIPSTDSYATPWYKQLAVHEYRHMVQYANINRSTVKALSYILGQQISLLSTGLIPFWFLEGDATMAETQASTFGRGLQPSFTMHYRAIADEMTARRNPDKWFSGSYKDYVPSHYELGYQLVAHSERKYGKYIWNDVVRYSSNYPFLIFTTQLALGKYYDTSTKKLFHETFGYLREFWNSIPQQEDSAEKIGIQERTYTTYEHPLYLNDTTLLVLKTDYDKPQRFVLIDIPSNREEHVCYTGHVSTRPTYGNGLVYWTEYRTTLWEQKVNSVMCYMKPGEWIPREFGGEKSALYPTPTPNGGLAYIRYEPDGRYTLVAPEPYLSHTFPGYFSVHGLAYDDVTDNLYYIYRTETGMGIGKIREVSPAAHNEDAPGRVKPVEFESLNIPEKTCFDIVTMAHHATISALRAGGGKLYFGSILSGRDEINIYKLIPGDDEVCESRITTSRYGSFSPAPSPDGSAVALTVYDRNGYHAALQKEVSPGEPVEISNDYPRNVVNPPIAEWNLPNEISLGAKMSINCQKDSLRDAIREIPVKKYSKAAHLFNFHSWAPAYYEPENITSIDDITLHLGVTAVSQNLLNTAFTTLGYGYTGSGHSLVRGKFTYTGWAPKFEVEAVWSNEGQRLGLWANPKPQTGKDYVSIYARTYLPLVLSSGYKIRHLTPSIQYIYRNSLVYNTTSGKYHTGQHLVMGSVSFSSQLRRARLDLIPRWGYVLSATLVREPADNMFATTAGAAARIFVPGLARHHGISITASYQNAFGKGYSPYQVLNVLPRGFDNFNPAEYAAFSVDYHFPIAYPDWGLSGVFFLKRIHMTVGGDYAAFTTRKHTSLGIVDTPGSMYSWGGTLYLDVAPFRLPSQGTCTVSAGLYFPHSAKPFFMAGFSIPL